MKKRINNVLTILLGFPLGLLIKNMLVTKQIENLIIAGILGLGYLIKVFLEEE